MSQHHIAQLSRLLAKRMPRRRVVAGIGAGTLAAVAALGRADTKADCSDEGSCFSTCNSNGLTGEDLGFCIAACQLAAAGQPCQANCFATVEPGQDLGLCLAECATQP